MRLTRIFAEVRIRPVFECEGCGLADEGSSYQNSTIDEPSMADFLDSLARIQKQSSCLPIGWASYGVGHYKCPKCVT